MTECYYPDCHDETQPDKSHDGKVLLDLFCKEHRWLWNSTSIHAIAWSEIQDIRQKAYAAYKAKPWFVRFFLMRKPKFPKKLYERYARQWADGELPWDFASTWNIDVEKYKGTRDKSQCRYVRRIRDLGPVIEVLKNGKVEWLENDQRFQALLLEHFTEDQARDIRDRLSLGEVVEVNGKGYRIKPGILCDQPCE